MNRQAIAAVVGAPCVTLTMYPLYQALGAWLGPSAAWRTGFLFYWVIWCVGFPVVTLGPRRILALFGPAAMSPLRWLLVTLPPAVALAGSLLTGPQDPDPYAQITLAAINGTMEEVLWRGVFPATFPSSRWLAVVWPSIWFGIWHLAPGALSMPGRSWMLAAGAFALGLALGEAAHGSRSIRWTVASHVLSGVLRF
jgi:hypothetical protein